MTRSRIHRYFRLALAIAGIPLAGAAARAAGDIDFSRQILPILSDNCFQCHGPDAKQRKGKLRLDVEEDVKRERDGGHVIVPGNSSESFLYQRIISDDPEEVMPPPKSHHSLRDEEINLLRRWIDEGAKWGKHWAFNRIERPEFPKAESPASTNPLDRFVEAKLAKEGLTLSPLASRETLIRRLSLDLRGLPPSPREVAAFLADESEDAYEKIVDGFLSSPAYGERMAWDWLDAARYADSNGYQGDNERTMWPWRDWVVDAFNRNISWSDLTIWQLAGDLLPDATFEQKLATGFCRNHMINGEGGRIAAENRVDYVMDMAETTGTVWMGLTMNCCRCHDHKFDPLMQSEYYQLFAFFNQTPVDGGGGNAQTPPVLAVPSAEQKKKIAELETQIADLKKQPRPATNWKVLKVIDTSAKQQQLKVLEDGSILAEGPNPDNDTYVVHASAGGKSITALRLEALRHKTHTKNSLSRADSGNFVLSGFEVKLDGKPLKFSKAVASFEQGSHQIASAFDGKSETGWAVYENRVVDREHEAIFFFEKPAEPVENSAFEITLRHDSPHKNHNLGRLRLSVTDDPDPKLTSGSGRPDIEALNKEIAGIRKGSPKVMVMEDRSKPRETFILTRGLYNKPGEKVKAGVPSILPSLPAGAKADRLALARWLVSRDHPLTARVTINRFWQQIFGIGLVKTPEDFGVQGEYPVHAELLDWLSADFMESGWDVKKLMKTIMTSKTYKQSSKVSSAWVERDPDNRLLARSPRFRLPSWMIRDQALAASSLLVDKRGGPPVKPYQPEGVWADVTFGRKKYGQDKGDALYRRSLYTFWRRIIGPTMFFDSAARQTCTVKSTVTNSPLHALSTLNDVTYVEAARVMAEKLLADKEASPAQRIANAMKRVLARGPSDEELAVLTAGYERHHATFAKNRNDAIAFLSVGESQRDTSHDIVEHAALATVCLGILNLDETLNKE